MSAGALSPIAFGVALLRRLVAEQSRAYDEGGPQVVMVEDIETMASGLEMAGTALGVLPDAPAAAPHRKVLALPAPEAKRKHAGGRPRRLDPDEKARRKKAYQRAYREQRKAKAAAEGAPA